jgi:hypothetical protein
MTPLNPIPIFLKSMQLGVSNCPNHSTSRSTPTTQDHGKNVHRFCHVHLNSRYILSTCFDTFPLTVNCSLSFPSPYRVCVHGMSLVLMEGVITWGEAGGLHEASRACVHSFPYPSITLCFTSISVLLLHGENTCSVSSSTVLITCLSPLRCWTRVVILLKISCQQHNTSPSLTRSMQIQNSEHLAINSNNASVFQTCWYTRILQTRNGQPVLLGPR